MPALSVFRPKFAHLVIALSGTVALMLAACFWPFEMHPRNRVAWLQGQHGLLFSGMGQAVSRDPFPAVPRSPGERSLTIEVAVRPQETDSRRSSFILTFVPDAGPTPLALAAWNNALRVHVAGPGGGEGAKHRPWTYLGDALVQGKTSFVTVVAREQGTMVYLDGVLRGEYPETRLPAGAAPLGRLLLGNAPQGKSTWRGEILALAVYERALFAGEVALRHAAWASGTWPDLPTEGALLARYDFAEGSGAAAGSTGGLRNDVLIPAVFEPLRRTVLQPPQPGAKLKHHFNLDLALNIIGFVPLGFLALAVLGRASRLPERRQSLAVVCSGFALSLAIELTQVFLPARSSSLTDLGANTAGTALGVLLCFVLQQRCTGSAAETRISEG